MLERAPPPGAEAAGGQSGRALLPAVIDGLVYEAAGKRLIDGLDLTLTAGPLTVIMGPNGAGKSLLLRLLHGLIQPSAGTMKWCGKPLSPAVRRRQAMVFQRPVLLRRSVAENLDFVLGLRGGGQVSRRGELLERVGLAGRASQPARRLSGGEQQRLALARALALDPDVMFLDEPTSNLDPASSLMIEQIVRAASMEGRKIVFVTHMRGQARRLADEVVFIYRGQVAEQTPAGEFFAKPRSAAARDFLSGKIVL